MFITFEGIEGSGKSTALNGLAATLENEGYKVVCTREPGGSALGRILRGALLNEESKICPEAELFLFLADRAQHVQEFILPHLEQGYFVLCDRYVDSTIAYQGGGRNLGIEPLLSLHKLSTNDLWPDLTLLLDVPVSTGINRATMRNNQQDDSINEKRFDVESANFHNQVRQNYIVRAAQDTKRFVIIDANKTPALVLEQCVAAVKKNLEQRK